MLSSTSNSSARAPKTPPFRLWTLALLLFVLSLGVLELVARQQGFRPMVPDRKEVWCHERERASAAGPNAIALVGASRMQNGIAPEELERAIPGATVTMLALSGRDAIDTLEHLAADDTFTGTVVYSATTLWLRGDYFWQNLTSWIDFYDTEWSFQKKLSTRTAIALQSRLALLHEGLTYSEWLERWSGRPYTIAITYRPSRFGELRWPTDESRQRNKRRANEIYRDTFGQEPFPTPEEMDLHFARFERIVDRLMKKGCRVVVLRMPSSGEVWELEEQYTPKALYWDRFASQTAANTIHFKDYPSLESFVCSDNTHLEYPESVRFSEALGEVLRDTLDSPRQR